MTSAKYSPLSDDHSITCSKCKARLDQEFSVDAIGYDDDTDDDDTDDGVTGTGFLTVANNTIIFVGAGDSDDVPSVFTEYHCAKCDCFLDNI